MKVLLINGSPNEHGCTDTALCEVAGKLNEHGAETEFLYLGLNPMAGCIACGKCFESGRCVFHDQVNKVLDKLDEYDGIIVGSPVYYAGPSSAFDRLNKYFSISNMNVVSSQFWNQVHGFTPEDVRKDLEGMQTMRTLGENMAWLLKCAEAAQNNGIPKPQYEPRIATNFIP